MTTPNHLRVLEALKIAREERRMLRRASDAASQWRLDQIIYALEAVVRNTPEEEK